VDDFSICVGQDYIQTLLPLIACGISLLALVTEIIRGCADRGKGGYIELNGRKGHAKSWTNEAINGQGRDGQADVTDQELDSGVLVAKIDKPRGEVVILVVELVALLGQVGVHIAVLLTRARGLQGATVAHAGVIVWGYIATLGFLRLLGTFRIPGMILGVWYHTASLYSLLWVSTVIDFRSTLIHSESQLFITLNSTNFALSTFLTLIALTTRRGNKAVILIHDQKLKPSPESTASLLSLSTFSWCDALVTLGYKRTIEMVDVYDLMPDAKARVLISQFRQVAKTSRLAWRLMRFFKWDLSFQFCWTVLEATVQFLPTLLLKAILEYVEDKERDRPSTPTSVAWLFVILLVVLGFTQGVSGGFTLWRGRQICIKLRALLVSEVYAKTLRRRTVIDEEEKTKDGEDKKEETKSKSPFGKFQAYIFNKEEKPVEKKATHVSSGTIINLMSVDSFKVSEICAYLHFLVPMVPLELGIAITLLYKVLGWSSIASVIVMILLIPINAWFSSQFVKAQKRILASTDARIHTTNEVLNNVRVVKFFAWEQKYIHTVSEKRDTELAALRYRFIVYGLACFAWAVTPLLITGISFFLYTVVEDKPLLPSIAFTALALFGLLRYPLDRLTDMSNYNTVLSRRSLLY